MTEQYDDLKKDIAENIRSRCIYYPSELMFGKLPGTRYASQFYMANCLYDLNFMEKISIMFHKIIQDNIGHFNFQLTGREWASIPLLTTLPTFMKVKYGIELNSFLIRKERKYYGRNNFIEGVPNDLPVLMVDDLCNSQDGFRHCNKVLKGESIETLPFVFAVVNKYSAKYSETAMLYDINLGNSHRLLFVVSRDDIL